MHLAVIFFVLILVISFVILSRKKYFYSLLGVFIMPWLLFILFNLLFVQLEPMGILFLEVAILLFILFYFLGYKTIAPRQNVDAPLRLLFVKTICISAVILGIISNLCLLKTVDIQLSDIQEIVYAAHRFSRIRYLERVKLPLLTRSITVYSYFALFVLSLYSFNSFFQGNRSKPFYVFPVAANLVLQALITGVKGYILYLFFYYFCGFMVAYKINYIRSRKRTLWYYFAIVLFSLFCFCVVSFFFKRALNTSLPLVLEKMLTSYLFLPSSAFISWFNENCEEHFFDFSGVKNIFLGVSVYLFGLSFDVKIGEATTIPVFGDEFPTNVYSGFKPIIMDLGVFGGCLLVCCIAFLCGIVEKCILNKRLLFIPLYVVLLLILLYLPYDSWFKYMSNILTFFLVIVYFAMLDLHKCRWLRGR